MSVDGFLQFLGLVAAVYALLNVVNRYRLRLLGLWLWLPTICTLIASVYLLLFETIGVTCTREWCSVLRLPLGGTFKPNILAFVIVLVWLTYIALISTRNLTRAGNLPLLAKLVDRLIAEKRFAEMIDFIEPNLALVSEVTERQRVLRQLRHRIRFYGRPLFFTAPIPEKHKTKMQSFTEGIFDRCVPALQWLEVRFPENSRSEQAAEKILRILHTNDAVVEFISLERPLVALKLMTSGAYDFDFGDRAFEHMMANSQSSLRRETMLNQNTSLCFYEIDPKNPLIYALFSDAKVAQNLEVYRPIGNYPLGLLDRNEGNYRTTISAAKPRDERFLERDPTYCMIRFFDIMVRSAMRDGISWHMWLLYFDILVKKILSKMDFSHLEFDQEGEFSNFGYYLIYEIFSTYGDWLQSIKCCPAGSPAVQIENVAPIHENGSILKTCFLSIGNSIKHLLDSEQTPDRMITYLLEMTLRYYRDLAHRPNGGARAQEAMRNAMLGGMYGPQRNRLARLQHCFEEVDQLLRFETDDFRIALEDALTKS